MKHRIPLVERLIIRSQTFPGFDDIREIMIMAKHSPEGMDAARRILTQLAYKALKEPSAGVYFRLYQVALEDIGENFDHVHPNWPLSGSTR